MKLEEAELLIDSILGRLERFVLKSSYLGSVRRKEEEIGDLDILIEIFANDVPMIKQTLQGFSSIHSGGEKKIRIGNIFGTNAEADIWLVYPPRNFYALQAIFTGPAAVNIKLRRELQRHGIRRPHSQVQGLEKDIFTLAGMPYVAPENRWKIV